ncbi:MAG: DUF5683 domain-containing protein [Bacteroidota bacterium]
MSKSFLFSLFLISILAQNIFGQLSTQDSIRLKGIAQIALDTVRNKDLSKIDSLKKIKTPFKINPKLATKKSAMIPGWGQAYAKQYWFIPIIYAGFGASTFGILYNGKRYQILKKAYFETSAANALDPTITKGKITLNKVDYELSIANLKQYTNYFRRNRDLSWLSIPVVWAVNVLEINVAAHLKSFDLSDDISMKFEPSFEPTVTGMPSLGGKVVFAFR